MKNLFIIAWLAGAVVAGVGLYGIAYEVEQMEKELTALEDAIRDEREAIHMLEAEWAYLARPERVEELSARFLPQLQPLTAKQVGDWKDIPYRSLPDVLDALPSGDPASPAAVRTIQ